MEMKKEDIKEGITFIYEGEKYEVGYRNILDDGNVVFVGGAFIFTEDSKTTDESIGVYMQPIIGLTLSGKIELNKCKIC